MKMVENGKIIAHNKDFAYQCVTHTIMIIPKYTIQPSKILNAGQGLYLTQPVKKGSIIVAPDKINRVFTSAEITKQFPTGSIEHRSSVRWFENYCTITPDWSDECYINHSFNPTGLWHLGFTFAIDDLPSGVEVTVDYRLLLSENEIAEFNDAQTGQAIIGLSWQENLRQSTTTLYHLVDSIS